MRLAGLALVFAACGGPGVGERPPPAAPVAADDPMQAWKALGPRGRDHEAKLASIPPSGARRWRSRS